MAEEYVTRLLKEMQEFNGEEIDTVFIGGGTPSLLPAEQILRLTDHIFDNFKIAENPEITIEVNPGTVDREKFKVYKQSGINRISVGVQSFNDEMLKILGRIHDGDQAEAVIKTAQDAGFPNVSADLMFSYKGQTEDIWQCDLETVDALGICHVSCYGLKVEEGTPFDKIGMENLDEDTDRKLQEMAVLFLKNCGFSRYEISNFAKPGYESRHNLHYWHCDEYIGLGAGAHSYIDGKRYNNILSPEKYIQSGNVRENVVLLTNEDKITEKFIMGMRLAEGVEEKFAEDKEALNKYIDLGYILRENGKVRFTDKGFDVSNFILSEII